jgi:hypothetical protein
MNNERLSFQIPHSELPSYRRQPHFNLKFEIETLPLSVSSRHTIYLLNPSPEGQTVLHVLQT